MLRRAKTMVLEHVRAAGGFRMAASASWRQQRLVVLAYHGVSLADEHEWDPDLYVSPAVFEARLRCLAEGGYNVLPLDEAVRRLAARSLPPRSVVITFDDGFADFRLVAWPLLRKFGFPATVYLTTWYVYAGKPIFNLLVPYLLWRKRGEQINAVARFGWTTPPVLSTAEGRRRAWHAILGTVTRNHLSGDAKLDLAEDVASELGVDYAAVLRDRTLRLMTPAEAAEVAQSNVSLQLHTHRHRTPTAPELFLRELAENSARIQEISGIPPIHFCYPSGRHRPDLLPLLRRSNIVSATTCDYGLATARTNPLLIPRLLDVQQMPAVTFEAWLCGLGSLLPRKAVGSPDQPLEPGSAEMRAGQRSYDGR